MQWVRVRVGKGFLKDYLRGKVGRQSCIAIGFMVVRFWMVRLVVGFWVVVGFRMQVGFWMVVGLRMQVWVWVVLVVISFMLVFCVVVRWGWRWEVMVGTVVEGVRVWDYLVWMVWLIVSWCLGEVRVIVMVGVGVVSRMGKRVGRAC